LPRSRLASGFRRSSQPWQYNGVCRQLAYSCNGKWSGKVRLAVHCRGIMWRSPRRTGHMGMVGTADTELAASAPGRCRLQDGCGQAAHQLQDVARSLGGRDRPSPPWLELERMPERMDCSETSSAEHKQEATERREARHMQDRSSGKDGCNAGECSALCCAAAAHLCAGTNPERM